MTDVKPEKVQEALCYKSWGVWRVTDGSHVAVFVARGLDDLAEQWKHYNGPIEGTNICVDPDKVELIAHEGSCGAEEGPLAFIPHPKLEES